MNPLVGATEFFNVNDLTDSIRRFDWGHLRPTNGASMLAAAVALAPQRLVIAGIDLFQHPDGSYPWAGSGPNAYSPGIAGKRNWSSSSDSWRRSKARLVIVGDILARAWREIFAEAPKLRNRAARRSQNNDCLALPLADKRHRQTGESGVTA